VHSLVRRILFAPLVFVVVATVIYGGMHVLRPDMYPGRSLVGGVAHDLDRTLFHLDFGCASSYPGCPSEVSLWQRSAPADLWLLGGALLLGAGVGIAAGLWCAAHPGSWLSRGIQSVASVVYCTPVYVAGLASLFLFNSTFGRVHIPGFFDAEPHWVTPWGDPWLWFRTYLVPWLILGAPLAGMCLRLTMATARESLGEDYMRTAEAKGLRSTRIIRRHLGPPAYAVNASFLGVSVPLIVTNMVLVERVMSVPGFFEYTYKAQGHNPESAIDYATLEAMALWAAVIIIVLGVLGDAITGKIDPRVRDAAF
jgi:peptide/nickel transport system permease protein